MKIQLMCPDDASAVPVLARKQPLVLTPFLGQTVLAHALTALAVDGVKQIQISAAADAEKIREVVQGGETWGIQIEVSDSLNDLPSQDAITLDRMPQLRGQPLWQSYRGWQAAQLALLPKLAADRVGMREITPGVFAGMRTQIAADAHLTGPCWIGDRVFIGSQVRIGADTIIEDGSYIDTGAEVSNSIIGRQTYVGAFMELRDSFASENQLLHLDSGSFTTISDRILLSRVRPRPEIYKTWRERFLPRQSAVNLVTQLVWRKNLSPQKPPLKALVGNEAAT